MVELSERVFSQISDLKAKEAAQMNLQKEILQYLSGLINDEEITPSQMIQGNIPLPLSNSKIASEVEILGKLLKNSKSSSISAIYVEEENLSSEEKNSPNFAMLKDLALGFLQSALERPGLNIEMQKQELPQSHPNGSSGIGKENSSGKIEALRLGKPDQNLART